MSANTTLRTYARKGMTGIILANPFDTCQTENAYNAKKKDRQGIINETGS